MAHKLLNLSSRVFNKPQYMLLEDFNNVVNYLVARNNGEVEITPTEKEMRVNYDSKPTDGWDLVRIGVNPKTMTGHLDISGTLVYKAGQTEGLCGGELISYERLEKQFKAQVDSGVKAVVLSVDSGGGEAYGCFESANNIKNLAKANNIKLYTYVDGTAASAAYAWASIADEVIANPSARVGSIGVVVQLMNNNKMLEKAGISRSFIYAGDNKIPFDEDGEFTTSFKNRIQGSVNKSYKSFVEFIAKNRTLQSSDVVATQAEVFDADEALSLGLIDKIMTREEFGNHLSTSNKQKSIFNMKEVNMSDSTISKELYTELELKLETQTQQLTDALASVQSLNDALTVATQQAKEAQEQATTFSSQAEALQLQIENAAKDAVTKERKEQLQLALGSENPQVETLLATFAPLSAEQFNNVVASYGLTVEKKAEEMKEVGKATDSDTANETASELAVSRAKQKWNKQD